MKIIEAIKIIKKLRAAGYVVAIFSPEEIENIDCSVQEIEESMIEAGRIVIASNHRKDSNND